MMCLRGRLRHQAPTSCRSTSVAVFAALAVLVALPACRQDRRTPVPDSVTESSATPAGAPVAGTSASGWQRAMGPALLVAGTTPDVAIVVLPDSARTGPDTVSESDALAIRSTPAVLVGHTDSLQLGVLQEQRSRNRMRSAAAVECVGWPTWQVTPPAGGAPLAPWTLGFVGSNVEPIALDSVESMSRADSAKLAAEVTRLASTAPAGKNADATRLAGLPFTVKALWRFHAAPGIEAVAASLVRGVNQEARPFEERTLLVAERDSTRKSDLFDLEFFERARGAEETVESGEILGVVRFGPNGSPVMVLGRDYGDGTAYSLVERESSGRWRVRWTSGRGRC